MYGSLMFLCRPVNQLVNQLVNHRLGQLSVTATIVRALGDSTIHEVAVLILLACRAPLAPFRLVEVLQLAPSVQVAPTLVLWHRSVNSAQLAIFVPLPPPHIACVLQVRYHRPVLIYVHLAVKVNTPILVVLHVLPVSATDGGRTRPVYLVMNVLLNTMNFCLLFDVFAYAALLLMDMRVRKAALISIMTYPQVNPLVIHRDIRQDNLRKALPVFRPDNPVVYRLDNLLDILPLFLLDNRLDNPQAFSWSSFMHSKWSTYMYSEWKPIEYTLNVSQFSQFSHFCAYIHAYREV